MPVELYRSLACAVIQITGHYLEIIDCHIPQLTNQIEYFLKLCYIADYNNSLKLIL